MSEMTPYPVGAEVADGHLSRSIDALDRKVSEGFDRVERRIDTMVTREAFDATVQRLDAKDVQLEGQIEVGFKDMDARVKQEFLNVKTADQDRNTRNRWFWGLMVTFAGVLSGTIFGILTLIMR